MSAGRVEALWARSVFSPVPARNAFEVSVERLARAIRLGVLAEGARLPPERELAETFGIARVTLREAIKALRDAGLLASRRGRGGGTFVVAPDPRLAAARHGLAPVPEPAAVEDLLELRRIVEPGAAALAASRALTGADRATLRQCLAEAGGCPPSSRRLADSRLHMALAAAGESPSVVGVVADVQLRLGELLAAIPVLGANIAHSDRQHVAILGAVLAGRPEQARAEMEEHVDATAALLRGLLC